MDTSISASTMPAPSSAMQIIRIVTISSVQILVLVIAGTSGFIISLLGLFIPDSLRSRPPTTPTTLRRVRSPSPTASRATSTPPSFHSSSSSGIPKNDTDVKNAMQDASTTQMLSKTLHAHPMSRGNSASSKSSTLPDLGNSSSTTSSCSSSISEHHKEQHTHHHHHHHHGMNATALYEGIVNRCRGKKATCINRKDDNRHPTAAMTTSEDKSKADKSCRSRKSSLSSPRNSNEGVRARLSSLIMPHSSSHSTSHAKEGSSSTANNHKRLSYYAPTLGSSSPVSPQDAPSRSATLPNVTTSSISPSPIEEVNVEDGISTAVLKHLSASATFPNGIKPPFLTRIFSFSSSSSSNLASSSSSSIEAISPTSTTSKHAFPTVSSSSSSSSQVNLEIAHGQIRPKARRLSTRLASFRTASSNGSKSRRTISESEASSSSFISSAVVDGVTGSLGGEELKSPPQTPRLGFLPPSSSSSSSSFTPGSNGTSSPLRSPLSRRSFFISSPSKSSPIGDLDITPQQSSLPSHGGYNNASPSFSTTTIGTSKYEQNRPGLGKRSASDNHSSTSFKAWLMNSSPSSSSSSKTRDEKVGRRTSVSQVTSTSSSPVAQRRISSVVGETRHSRYVSDSAANATTVLRPVQERGRKEERRRSLAVVSPPPAPSLPLGISKPRQNKAYRSLSYAPPPSHAVLVNKITTTTSTSGSQPQAHPNVIAQSGFASQQQKPFVPFHPFLDQDYGASSLDLSGTSALTMSLHFSDVGKADS